MEIYKASSVSSYLKIIEQLGMENFIYRGQNEPYDGIKANGFRTYKGSWQADKIFDLASIAEEFYQRIISKITMEEKKEFPAFCQHHGLPTNLIDFSYSPLIALFFACYGKTTPKFSIDQLIGQSSIHKLKKDKSIQKILIENLINMIEKPIYSDYAQVYLIDKRRLMNISDIISDLKWDNFFLNIYQDSTLRIKLFKKLVVLFNELEGKEISQWLFNLIECYRTNNTNFFEILKEETFVEQYNGISDDEYETIFTFQALLIQKPLQDIILDLYYYVVNEMEDERIPLESDHFDGSAEEADAKEIAAMTYILLLSNLVQIYANDNNGSEKLHLDLDINFTYQPANLFDRIEAQRGLFVYQPYIYTKDMVYDFKTLSVQNINPVVCIEIENHQTILNELDYLGINVGGIYKDFDNIAKSIVLSYRSTHKIL